MANLLLAGVDMSRFCSDAAGVLQFVGWILTVFKIAVPLLIIGYGMFDLGKAVVGSKDDDIKKASKQLMMRAVAGVIIFFIPSIVLWLFQAIGSYNAAADQSDFPVCRKCILTPWNCEVSDTEY